MLVPALLGLDEGGQDSTSRDLDVTGGFFRPRPFPREREYV